MTPSRVTVAVLGLLALLLLRGLRRLLLRRTDTQVHRVVHR